MWASMRVQVSRGCRHKESLCLPTGSSQQVFMRMTVGKTRDWRKPFCDHVGERAVTCLWERQRLHPVPVPLWNNKNRGIGKNVKIVATPSSSSLRE